jgi:hypothetical protein
MGGGTGRASTVGAEVWRSWHIWSLLLQYLGDFFHHDLHRSHLHQILVEHIDSLGVNNILCLDLLLLLSKPFLQKTTNCRTISKQHPEFILAFDNPLWNSDTMLTSHRPTGWPYSS